MHSLTAEEFQVRWSLAFLNLITEAQAEITAAQDFDATTKAMPTERNVSSVEGD